MDFSEKWGTSVDEAVELALQDLKLSREEVKITVLEEPSKGFFGIGSKLALVRVEKKEEPKPEVAEPIDEKFKGITKAANPVEAAPKQAPKEKRDRKERKEKPRKEKPQTYKMSEEEKEEIIAKISPKRPEGLTEVPDHPANLFLKEMTEKMGLDVSIKVYQGEDCIYVDVDGADSGSVIGKRGQTLDAIQYLTSLVVNKGNNKYMRVVVDAESYRTKREKTLIALANRLADKVVKSKKSVRLEPMNPYERKVIHATLQSNPNVTTRSEGEEPFRRVIIELK